MWVCLPCFANIFQENVCLGMLSKSNAQGVLLMTSVHFLRYFPKYDFCRHPPYRATFTRESRSRKRLLKNPGALLQNSASQHTQFLLVLVSSISPAARVCLPPARQPGQPHAAPLHSRLTALPFQRRCCPQTGFLPCLSSPEQAGASPCL